MDFLSKLFSRKEEPKRPAPISHKPEVPTRFDGPVQVLVEQGLSAHFFRKDGVSWPGVDWAVACVTATQQKVFLVRTYHSQNPPNPEEKPSLAKKAADYISGKIARGEAISHEEEHVLE
jgi:hypothetical protein